MKTNKNALKAYLVGQISFEGYNIPTPTTEAEKVRTAMKICRAEMGQERRTGTQVMIEHWFSGLCSVVSLPYTRANIIKTARKFSEFTEDEEEKIYTEWFHYMAAQFAQLARKHNA